VLRQGCGSRPHVLRISYRDSDAVLKDFDGCDKWFALAFGALLARRESAALAALDGIEGIPQFLGRSGDRALLMQYVAAQPAVKVHATQASVSVDASPADTNGVDAHSTSVDWSDFLDRLQSLVRAIHEAGVAHGDLRSPMNTLVTATGAPVLVDFTAAFLRHGWPLPGRGWVFAKLSDIDRSAVTKMALRVDPGSISELAKKEYERRGVLDRVARRTGQSVRFLSRLLTQRH